MPGAPGRQPAGGRGDRVRRAVGRRGRWRPAGRRSRRSQAARERAARATSLFYVDTLEYLRRGGRIGAAAAIFGGALSVKPLLKIADGKVANLEKVRTSSKALNRLEALVLEAAGDDPVDVCVAHLASPDRADAARRAAGRGAGRQPRWPRGVVHRARRRARRPRRARHGGRLRGAAPLRRLSTGHGSGRWRGPSRLPSVAGMSGRPRRSAHEEAVARRLELLGAELAGVPAAATTPRTRGSGRRAEPDARRRRPAGGARPRPARRPRPADARRRPARRGRRSWCWRRSAVAAWWLLGGGRARGRRPGGAAAGR